ncbi:HAD-IC family P-type ATPase [Williamsoniiplasma lucivorax]|uniref:Mg(2+) transport ATPase, P-type n=1 Tax=Williamsoniiplasma lucivorax TaxID=209274 RepID=A0A2S5RFC9_9MOLU|nr:HAD-IC family P-type ATPase [Williamsoniiplasma lucivorax]PPE05997.1 Mg(2+) transport ATPase, P-type [Williamsoniiplasma lucivorax]
MKKKTSELKYTEEQKVLQLANNNIQDFAKKLDIPIGVEAHTRAQRQESQGKNELIHKKFNHLKKLFGVLIEPFNLLLFAIGVAECLIYLLKTHELIDLISAFVIFFMIVLAGGVDYTQEYKAYKSNKELHHMIENTFMVYDGKFNFNSFDIKDVKTKLKTLDQSELIVGDVIFLQAGDVIPADIRIIYNQNLLIDEASLTGESEAVSKFKDNQKGKTMIQMQNIGFSQTTVVQGSLLGVVINVGIANYAASISKMAEEQETTSEYEKGLAKVTKVLIISILAMIPIIFITSGLRLGGQENNWIQALIFALTIAVSLIPEALPAIISSNLQLGSKQLAKEKVVIKDLGVVQNLGSVNVLAMDKTGTLTNDQVTLNSWVNYQGQQSDHLAQLIYLNAINQQNLSNKIEQGIFKVLNETCLYQEKYTLLADQPFDHETRIASVLVKFKKEVVQITKGSVEEMLTHISFIKVNDEVVPITKEHRAKIADQVKTYSKQGFRTLVIASNNKTKTIIKNKLVYEGMLLFEETIKPHVKEAIKLVYDYNIDLKILTGDAQEIALNIAKTLEMKHPTSLTGEEIFKLKDQQMSEVLKTANVLVKLSPIEKARIIDLLQSKDNDVVAYLGDGVNDMVSLKKADVGIAVNNGTSLAKAAASVILLEKDLAVLEKSFIKGREIFTNAIKYINITIAANFGLMMTLLISSFWFTEFLAMQPVQLLLQNLLYDFANLIFVFDKVDKFSITHPKKWSTNRIIVFAFWNGLVATLISLINFFIVGYGMGLFNQIDQGMEGAIQRFQTTFFLESMITHMILILVYRTEKISLLQSRPSWQLVCGMVFFIGLAFLITYVQPIASIVKFQPPNKYWLLVMLGLILLTWLLGEFSKFGYQKVFKQWY